jgi:uncharacterized protein YlbG (UPF0298 family)
MSVTKTGKNVAKGPAAPAATAKFPCFVKVEAGSTPEETAAAVAARFGGIVKSSTKDRFFVLLINETVELEGGGVCTEKFLKDMTTLLGANNKENYTGRMESIAVENGFPKPGKKLHSRPGPGTDKAECNPYWGTMRDLLAKKALENGGIIMIPYHTALHTVWEGTRRGSKHLAGY